MVPSRKNLRKVGKSQAREQFAPIVESLATSKWASLRDEELDKLPAICVLKDHYGAFVYANKQMAQWFEQPTGGFVGKTDFHVMSDDDALVIRRNDKEVLSSGKMLQTVEYVSSDGAIPVGYFVTKFLLALDTRRFLAVIGIPLEGTADESAIAEAREWTSQNFDYIAGHLRELVMQNS